MRKSQYSTKRDKSNLAAGESKKGYRPAKSKKRSKCNMDLSITKRIIPICPFGGKCIQPTGKDGYNPENCKKCVRMKDYPE
jgi:hypothetical protein